MADFSQYKAISGKLKKRFLLRKPNLNEISEQFASLGRDLRDFKSYSGYCSLAVARCEHNMGNSSSEMQALLDAARMLKQDDQVNAAISAYRHALKIADEPLMTPIFAELARLYISEKRFSEAAMTYAEGKLYKEAAQCHLIVNQFEFALDCFNKLNSSQLEPDDLVTIFLIKLYLNDPMKFNFKLPIIDCHPDNDKYNDLNILLESLLTSMRSKNKDEDECRNALVDQLFPRLNGIQNEILYKIVTNKSL